MSALERLENSDVQRTLGRLEGQLEEVRSAVGYLASASREHDRKLSKLCASVRLADRAGAGAGRKWGAFAGAMAAGLLSAAAKALGVL